MYFSGFLNIRTKIISLNLVYNQSIKILNSILHSKCRLTEVHNFDKSDCDILSQKKQWIRNRRDVNLASFSHRCQWIIDYLIWHYFFSFQHWRASLQHPYPTEDEKRTIAAQTNLTLLQVCIWLGRGWDWIERQTRLLFKCMTWPPSTWWRRHHNSTVIISGFIHNFAPLFAGIRLTTGS